jgi:hypothetical protein
VKRLECVELAPAFGGATTFDSGSKLHALSRDAGLRDTRMPFLPYDSISMPDDTK